MEERRLKPLTAAICTLVLGLAIEPANAAPNKAPMSDRLSAIDAFFEDEVSNHRLPGAVALVVRDDKVIYLKAFGERDPAAHEPMRVDTLFRLYSMSKPIATVAALQLVEDGRLHLDDPVAKYIPEFASVQVYAPPFVPGGPKELEQKLLPAKHAPTIHDLVRHTSGLTYGQGGPANWRDYQATNLIPETWQKTDILIALTNAEVARRAASVPLAFEPGTQWAYGRSTDVLGRVIEVASGKPLDEYLADGLFKPLGMKDTVFNLSLAVWLMKGFLDEIPAAFEEAAVVDGYSRFGAFVRIVLPEARTGIAVTAVFCLISAWNEYGFAMTLNSSGALTVRTKASGSDRRSRNGR